MTETSEKHLNFLCRTCGETSVVPARGTIEDRLWRQAWQDEGRVACCECLGVFWHGTVTVIEEVNETDNHPTP